jgi:hypothetical protein
VRLGQRGAEGTEGGGYIGRWTSGGLQLLAQPAAVGPTAAAIGERTAEGYTGVWVATVGANPANIYPVIFWWSWCGLPERAGTRA